MTVMPLSFSFERRRCNSFHGAVNAFWPRLLDEVMAHFSYYALWTRWCYWEV